MSASDSPLIDRPRSRRGVLGLLAAGGGAALATLFGRPEQAQADDGDPLILGAANRASSKTSLIGNVDLDFAFTVENRSLGGLGVAQFRGANRDGLALHVDGVTLLAANRAGYGAFIRNDSPDPEAGGLSVGGSGLMPVILATSDASLDPDTGPPVAISGRSTGGGVGVEGSGETGVSGNSSGGFGVQGLSETGIAGHFHSFEGIGIGVTGRAAFSTVGGGTIPAGENSVFVENTAVADTSHVSVTFVSDPGGRQLKWIERTSGSGFRVHARGPAKARPATAFTYFIVEQQEPQLGG